MTISSVPGSTYPPTWPVGLEAPDPVAPSAKRRAAKEKKRGAATERALLMIDVRSIVISTLR